MKPKIRVYREGVKLNSLSDSSLLDKTKALVAEERSLTTQVLWHLAEIQKRRLYAQQGYGSLFEYAVKVLGYSEAAAGRRIAAMRLLVQVPEVEESVKSGALNLSTLSSVHHFLKEKETPTSHAEKLELLQSLEGKSRRECEKQLAALCPAAPPAERERVITPELTEIRFVADEALMGKLQKLRELDAHVQADPSYLELFHRLADLALKKLDPEQKKSKQQVVATPPAESRSVAPSDSRTISAAVKRAVHQRDQGVCAYVSPDGKRCGSRYALEFDHVMPVAKGGLSTVDNLRLVCRTHNQQAAIQEFGRGVMGTYLTL